MYRTGHIYLFVFFQLNLIKFVMQTNFKVYEYKKFFFKTSWELNIILILTTKSA